MYEREFSYQKKIFGHFLEDKLKKEKVKKNTPIIGTMCMHTEEFGC